MIFGLIRQGADPSVNAMASLVLLGTTVATMVAFRLVSPRDLTR